MLMAVTMVAAFTGCGDSKKPAASDTEDTSNKEIEAADYYASVQKNAEIYKLELNMLNSLIGSKNIEKEFEDLVKKYNINDRSE